MQAPGASSFDGMTDGVRNLEKALASISAHWQPHRLTSINDYDVKVVKLQGEFLWHTHPDTDELFLVISGERSSSCETTRYGSDRGTSLSCRVGLSTVRRPSTRCRQCSSSLRAR